MSIKITDQELLNELKRIKDIIKRVEVGRPLEQALNEIMEVTPSDNFRKLLFSFFGSILTSLLFSIFNPLSIKHPSYNMVPYSR